MSEHSRKKVEDLKKMLEGKKLDHGPWTVDHGLKNLPAFGPLSLVPCPWSCLLVRTFNVVISPLLAVGTF